MFSSNQQLTITMNLTPENIRKVLAFVEDTYEASPNAFQITEDKRFVLGKIYTDKDGWERFQFEPELELLSHIIYNHLSTFKVEEDIWDGSYHKGFKVEAVRESLADEDNGIKNPFYAIVQFSPYTVFYSK